ncbi:MAG: transporter substrate-binding domain-containing protein [Synergistaceae bacterium]|nr:transporter substrate-binding domain-containing protein [Synergistaceae bacterium]
MKSAVKLSAALCIIMLLSGASFAGVSSVNSLKSAKVGVMSGSVSEYLAQALVSGDSGQVISFGTIGEIIAALRSRDVDAAVMDETPARYFAETGTEFRILAEPVDIEYYAIAFRKGNPLRDEVDKILDAVVADKTLAAIMDKYLKDDPDPSSIDMNVGAKGGKLWVGCAASFPPYELRTPSGFAGIDIELCAEIARRMDRELVIADYRFDALPEALETGKIDMICSALTVTEDRVATMDFTKPYDANQEVVLVLADGK